MRIWRKNVKRGEKVDIKKVMMMGMKLAGMMDITKVGADKEERKNG